MQLLPTDVYFLIRTLLPIKLPEPMNEGPSMIVPDLISTLSSIWTGPSILTSPIRCADFEIVAFPHESIIILFAISISHGYAISIHSPSHIDAFRPDRKSV